VTALVVILTIASLLWWIAVGVWRNTGWANGCAVTTAWGTIPVWSLWLGGLGVILGLTIGVIEVAVGRKFSATFGASFAISSLAGFVAAVAGYNIPRIFLTYTSCPLPEMKS